jgi:ribosomal protein S27AE
MMTEPVPAPIPTHRPVCAACGESDPDAIVPIGDDRLECGRCGAVTAGVPVGREAAYEEAVILVMRAASGILTAEAGDRLRTAVATHNDGRVRRMLTKAARARERARAESGDRAEQFSTVWAKWLHRALDESWPVDHPAYRRCTDPTV